MNIQNMPLKQSANGPQCASILTACVAVLILATSTQGAHFTRVADTTTQIPGRNELFAGFRTPSVSGSTVTFGANTAAKIGFGIYSSVAGGPLARVVESGDLAPDGTLHFDEISEQVVSGSMVVFRHLGPVTEDDPTGTVGFYARSLTGDQYFTIADEYTQIPSGVGNFSGMHGLSVSGSNVVFLGGNSEQGGGIYAGSTDGGQLSRLVDRNTPLPFADGNHLPNGPSGKGPAMVSGSIVAFRADSGSSKGIFIQSLDGGDVNRVVDTSSAVVPESETHFYSVSPVGVAGDQLVFRGNYDDRRTGFYTVSSLTGGAIACVVDQNTAIPSGIGNFSGFALENPWVTDTNVVFHGLGSDGQDGIYYGSLSGGPLSKLIAAGDELDGRIAQSFRLGTKGGSDSSSLAFVAQFTNGESGVYLANLGAPGDTNGDGVVDLEDLNNVRNHFGATGAPGLPGDAIPFDGVVDLSDLNAVRNNFGATNGASAVPEPTTGLLLVAGCFCFGVWHLARSAVQRKGVSAIARRIALAMAMLCPCAAARAETVEWIRQLGTPLSDSAQGVTVDPFGSIFVTGNVLGQTSNPDAGTDDFFVSKYDPSGAVIWTRQFGTTARDVSYGIAADALGNVFVAGNTTGSLAAPNDGQPTPNEPFLSKLDTNGEVLWTQQFGSLHGFSDVAVDLHGDVIVAATGVSKISAAGERLWTRQIFDGTGPIVGNSIATDSDGNIFIAGSASASSAFLNKYGEDGNLLWTRVFQLEEQNKAGGVAADNDGNIYVTGITAESFAFPQYDGFLRKYDESGSLLWSRQFGDPEGFDTFSDIALDDLGNIVVVGTQRDPGATGAGPYDALAVMYDADGELQWTRRLASDGDDSASAVAMAGNGRIYIVGETRGDLGGPRAGEYDAFLAKIRLGDLLPGDADGDGDVDLADLNAVRNDFGIAGDGIPGDTNADGIVDLEDLNAVRNNFSATGGGAAVPEPETAVLLVSLAAALLLGCALNAQAVTAKRGRYGALISMMLLALVSTPSAAREIVAIDRLRYALFDFSANGMVAVGSTPEQGIEPAYWTRATGTQNFLEFTPYNDGFATGVSGDGRVICGHGSPNGAFRWTEEEGPIGLGGWTTKEISQDGGTIVGQRSDRPVIWNQQQGMLELSAPAGWNYGYFKSVSADGGVVAAVAEVHPSEGVVAAQQAMLWNRQSGYRGIGTLPDGWVTSFPIQLSADGGTLLGTAKQQMGDSPQGLPFLWTVESGVEALPTLAGGRYTDLHMTSDASVVVGNEWVDNEFTPVVWDAQHGARPLRDVLRESHGFTDEELSFNLVRGISDDQRVIVMIAPSATSTDFDTYAIYLDRPLTLDGLPGDTDADGDVDLHDLNNVRNHFGGTGLGDTNADGTVDLEDLNAVRNYFGEVSPATVPEPASWILLTLGACGSFRRFVKKIGG